MKSENEIKKILDSCKFGLTKDEVASKAGINEANAARMLDNLAERGSIKKTKAGKNVFYKSLLVLIPFFFLMSVANAQQLNSTSFNMRAQVVDSGGGMIFGSNYRLSASIGQISNSSSSVSFNLCAGFLCNFLELVTAGKVTFLLEFNISGNANDTGFVDNFTALRQYRPSDIINYYACIHDTSLNSTPTFGMIFAGSQLNYINLSSGNSFIMSLSQDIPGNKLILPVTSGNCTVFNSRISQIQQFGTVLQPFVIAGGTLNAIELALSYSAIDIVGSFDRSGSFAITIEKNATNDNQIIIKPV